jgi:hypothetical protein
VSILRMVGAGLCNVGGRRIQSETSLELLLKLRDTIRDFLAPTGMEGISRVPPLSCRIRPWLA